MGFLAGLMGMAAIGAGAFFGMSEPDDEDEPGEETAKEESSHTVDENSGNSVMDFATGESSDCDDADGNTAEDAPPDIGTGERGTPAAETQPDETELPGLTTVQAVPDASEDSDDPDETISAGTDNADTITGVASVDLVNGYAGDDTVRGGDGGDRLWGGEGDDRVRGDAGDDTVHGQDGDDRLWGGKGADSVFGHNGDDSLDGGTDDDSLVGSAGKDALIGGSGDDALHGGLGSDTLSGDGGRDNLFGGWGDDALSGLLNDPATGALDDIDGRDYLNGGGGNDMILAGKDDIVTPGTGADTVALGDWITPGHAAEILGFSAEDDGIMVLFDDNTDADPQLTLEMDSEDAARQHILLNGTRIASVADAPGLGLGHITLVAQSSLPAVSGA